MKLRHHLIAAVSIAALCAAGAAWADSHDGGTGGQQGPGTSGQQFGKGAGEGGNQGGGHDGGHDSGHDGGHDDGHDDTHDTGHDGAGPGGSGNQGGQGGSGRPVWAQEGIPDVELGRLNVVRSPTQVLDRAYAEAIATFTPSMASFYSLTLDQMIAELSLNWDDVEIIDSPLQNLALFRQGLTGPSALLSMGVANSNDTIMAAFLGTAADKNLPISPETAYAIAMILGQTLTPDQASDLATDAERIRIAILAGHG